MWNTSSAASEKVWIRTIIQAQLSSLLASKKLCWRHLITANTYTPWDRGMELLVKILNFFDKITLH